MKAKSRYWKGILKEKVGDLIGSNDRPRTNRLRRKEARAHMRAYKCELSSNTVVGLLP